MNSAEMESCLLSIDEALFVEENCTRKKDLCATYILIGCPLSGETCKVSIVKDKDLPEAEKSLKFITSKHIYSVQKCSELGDINVLYAAEKENPVDEISKGVSSIDFNCNERDNALIAKLKLNALPVVSKQSVGIAKKITSQPAKLSKSPLKNGKNEQVSCCKCDEGKESDLKTENKKAVIPSMFKTSVESKKKPIEKASVNAKKGPGIGAFFSKTSKPLNETKKTGDSSSATEEKKQESKVEERLSPLKENKPTLNICNKKKSSPVISHDTPEPISKSQKTISKSKTSLKKEGSKAGKKKSGKKPEKEQKKRRRLHVLSDDSESNHSEEEEVVREPTPEPQATVISDNDDEDDIVYGTPQPSSRKRKKKLVSKTYQAPDGYMVTEKVIVEESCSEDEETVPEKKSKADTSEESSVKKPNDSGIEAKSEKLPLKDKKESPKTITKSPQKTKQASLMSFFKKK